jgi:hypothetical protein
MIVTKQPASRQGNSERIEIHYSLVVVIFATVLFAWVAGAIIFWAIMGFFSGHVLGVLFGAAATLVGVPMLLPFASSIIHSWRHKGPVVTMDIEGVADVRKKHSFIPWRDIAHINLGAGNTASFLCFDFRQADRQRQDLPNLGPLGTILARARWLGDWNISLRMLTCNRRELLRAARRLRQESIRRQVVELNREKYAAIP